jgi:hypothetical protein
MDKYEKKFGEIKLVGDPSIGSAFGFQPPTKEEKFH